MEKMPKMLDYKLSLRNVKPKYSNKIKITQRLCCFIVLHAIRSQNITYMLQYIVCMNYNVLYFYHESNKLKTEKKFNKK